MRRSYDRMLALVFGLALFLASVAGAHAGPYEDALAKFTTDDFDDTIDGINAVKNRHGDVRDDDIRAEPQ